MRGRIRELERRRSSRLGDEFTGVESARLDRGIEGGSSFGDLVAASQRLAQGSATRADLQMLQDENLDPVQAQLAQQAATAQLQAAAAQEQAAAAQDEAAAAMITSLGPESEFGDLLRQENTDATRTLGDLLSQEQDRQEYAEEQANSFNGFRREYNRETDRQIQAVQENTKLSSAERARQVNEIRANRENVSAFRTAAINASLGIGEDTRWVGMQVEGLGPVMNAGFSDLSDTVKGLANLPLPTVNVINELKPVAPQINWNPVYNIAVNDVKRATAIVNDIQTQVNQGVVLEDVVGRLFAGALR